MPKSENELTWRDLEIGGIVTEPGNASQYQTGDWRSQKPTYDFDRCIKCGLCQLFCPEGCIEPNADGHFEADLYYCKGCGICARECWTKVITMVEEE
ncbi:MAG TPA: 4Fe-4S binding protein [Dehalococcoidales bacterium]|nr:4Fe-4S binding protein [Dehalococcoidales bacterium]